MLYLNKELFKPALILLSAAFGLLLTLFLILMIAFFHFILLIVFFALAIAYGVLVFLAWRLSKSTKYYMTSGKGFLEIQYPTINYGRGKLQVPFQAIMGFQYFPLKALSSWKNFVTYGAAPECIYIQYVTKQGRTITELMGYVTYDEIKAVADQLNVEVAVMN